MSVPYLTGINTEEEEGGLGGFPCKYSMSIHIEGGFYQNSGSGFPLLEWKH